jgi:solute carrier family 25 S-adenosylmethionine transporter 26
MLGSFPAAATFWTTYELAKGSLSGMVTDKDYLFVAHAGAAALADIAVCTVRNPFEVVKQQLQAGLHTNTQTALRTILRVDGVKGLYAGYFSTIIREIPFDAIEFALYEQMKTVWKARKQPGEDLVLWENAILGSIAGGFAAAVTTPLDVIKTRMMTQLKHNAAERYTGWLHAFQTIRRQEGTMALFSGIRPRVAWISVGGAIFIGSFEEMKRRSKPYVTLT